MISHSTYQIPLAGLKNGRHTFDFKVNDLFFSNIEHSGIRHGDISVHLEVDKKATVSVLDFHLEGTVEAECSRCMGKFDLFIEARPRLIAHPGDVTREESEEVLIYSKDEGKLDLSQYIYEFICLQVPLRAVHPREKDCDPETINIWKQMQSGTGGKSDPRWDKLKNLLS